MQPIVVPKLAAAAVGLGIGVAVFVGAGAAAADPSTSAPGHSASASSKESSAAGPSDDDASDDAPQEAGSPASEDDGAPRKLKSSNRNAVEVADDEVAENGAAEDAAGAENDESTDGDAISGSPGSATPDDQDEETPADDDVEPVSSETSTVDVVDSGVTGPAPRPASPLRIVMDSWLAGVTRALGYAPVDPEEPTQPLTPARTWLAEALSALRRAADDNPANEMPTSRPVQLHQFVTGEVLGDLRPKDVDGDTLTFDVLQGPANGSLIVNANGTYNYKPTSHFAEAGGRDTFYIAVYDGNQNQSVVPVNVTVAPTLGVSRNFWFRNYTLAPLRFNGYLGGNNPGDLDSGPTIGTIINPGREYGWEVTRYFFSRGSVVPQFGSVGFGATPSNPGYIPDGIWGTIQVAFKTYWDISSTECASGGAISCQGLGDTTMLAQNTGGKTVTLSGAEAAKVASVLTTVCVDSSIAACTFDAKSEVAGYAAVKQIGAAVVNGTTDNLITSIQISDTASQTDSVGVSVKMSGGGLAKLASIINLEITTTYQHSWTNTHTFTQTVGPMTIKPGQTGWVQGGAPVWRVTGDFTIKIGTSTYQLNGATFDTPNPNGVQAYVGCTSDGTNPGCKLG